MSKHSNRSGEKNGDGGTVYKEKELATIHIICNQAKTQLH